MKKTIFSKFIATLMTGAVLISTAALGTGFTASAATTGPTISASSFNASAGQTVEVPIKISNNTQGVRALLLTVDYGNYLEYEGYIGNNFLSLNVQEDEINKKVGIGGISTGSSGDNTIVTLQFTVKNGAPKNTSCNLDVAVVEIVNTGGTDISNSTTVVDGVVAVKLKGDVNLSGAVNSTDANLVLTHATKAALGISYLPADVLYLADVDENGVIDSLDSAFISQYAQGGKTWEQILGW